MSNKHRRGGLGRGLGALIPTAPVETSENGATDVDGTSTAAVSTDSTAEAQHSPVDPHGAQRADGTSTPAESPTTEPSAPQAHSPQAHSRRADSRRAEDDGPAAVPGATLADLPIVEIHPNAKQPRQVFDDDALAELTHSIHEFGVLQPVVVRADADAGGWELVMGERRLRAAMAAGLTSIPAIIRTTDDDAMLRDALLENIHRVALNPLEEAAAYQQLLEEFGSTHDELAARLGRSRPQVSNTIRLLNLSLPVQRRVAAGVLSAGHARALLSLDQRDQQDQLAGRIVAEGLSVRATEELVSLAGRNADAVGAARRTSGPRLTAPGVAALAGDLSDAFDTRVRVDIGRRKGKITVEFASIDDLERIVALMAPQVATSRRSAASN